MAGQGGLDGHPGRLDVTDLAHRDHVGVLAQDGLEPGGEGEPGLVVGLDLVDGGEDVLDRVLDGHDVEGRVVDLAQGGVEGGGLPASRRAGTQHHAEGSPHRSWSTWRGCQPAFRGRPGGAPSGSCPEFACTHFSPQMVAVVATRTSISLSSTIVVNWPSCGRRRSTMFIPAMILMRLTRPRPIAAGRTRISLSAPSIRKRTAPLRRPARYAHPMHGRAWPGSRMRSTTWTTGASSATTTGACGFDGALA